jgi:hypothetical protein
MFFNQAGVPSLFIHRNEWAVFSDSWDVEVIGPSVTVRTGPREITLRLCFVPGEGLVVERLNMHYGGYSLLGDADRLEVRDHKGHSAVFTRCISDNSPVGFSLG